VTNKALAPVRGKSIFEQGAEGRSLIVKLFEGREIRFVDAQGVRWSVLPDVRNALGIGGDVSTKIVKRIKLIDPSCSTIVTMAVVGETDPFKAAKKITLVNSIGLTLFLNQIHTERLGDPEVQRKCRDMQLWSAELSEGVISGKTERATIEALKNAGLPIADTWQEQRSLSKIAHNMLMDTLKEVHAPKYFPKPVPQHIYMNENKMLNKVSYGHHEVGIRDKNRTDLPATALLTINSISDRAYARMGQDYHSRKNLLEEDAQQFHKLISGKAPKLLKGKQTSLAGF
jgi:hypothetical protein